VDEKVLESILLQLAQMNISFAKLTAEVEGLTADLKEFSDRFEEVVTQLEDERRLDLMGDFN
jgi:hypothetical protein